MAIRLITARARWYTEAGQAYSSTPVTDKRKFASVESTGLANEPGRAMR